MNTKRLGLVIALTICFFGCLAGIQRVSARQVLLPSAEDVRFQLIGNEPIAGPDGRSLVTGWSVLVFKDRKAGQCYVAFKEGPAITATQAATCPQ